MKNRCVSGTRPAELIGAAAAIAAGTQAYAAPVRFDNPDHGEAGHHEWSQAFLDITKSAANQPNPPLAVSSQGPGLIAQYSGNDFVGPSTFFNSWGFVELATAGPGRYPVGMTYGLANDSGLSGSYFETPNGRPPGSPQIVILEFYWTGKLGYAGGIGSNLVDTNLHPTYNYLATRFDLADGTHYGWIAVKNKPGTTFFEMDAVAWGYETEAGVGITLGAVPGPGTLSALALGAAVGSGRKRRSSESL